MRNKIQLITYPNSLGKDLQELDLILEKFFPGAFGGLHVLPFYPSSGDRGFAPLTYLEVDPHFGSWEDIKKLGKKYDLIADLMVNHISAQSVFFQDYLEKGESSKYADWFITAGKFSRRILPRRKKTYRVLSVIENLVNAWRRKDKLFHLTGVNKSYLKKIYRPRPGTPFVNFKFKDGQEKYLWCTFTPHQIDLDVNSGGVKELLENFIANLSRNGVNMIRLDAIGYAIKKKDTTSFMLPETRDFIRWISYICHENNVLSLPEVHHHYSCQLDLAKIHGVDLVYDFQLPLLALHALYEKDNRPLLKWLAIRPEKIITTLDTHDGIPVVDAEELLTPEEIKKTSGTILQNEGNEAKRASGDNGAENVDTYQINCTYYSALGEDDDAYIAARAIQFFLPGIPQIYYDGLLAGRNDLEKFERTNIGRDIMRHNYNEEEIKEALHRSVVQRLLKLIRFRNDYPVFDGRFSFEKSVPKNSLILSWKKDNLALRAEIDLAAKKVIVYYTDPETEEEKKTEF